MKLLFFSFFSFFISSQIMAQNKHEFVRIEEKNTGKRVELFAVNTNDISYDIFLKVDATGYRRSSARPIIKTIPANSRVRLITMVKLNNVSSNYTYTLVVNEIAYALEMQKDHSDFKLKIDTSLKSKTVSLFTKDNCLLCDDTKQLLQNNKINYTEFNIDQDSTLLIKLLKEFKKYRVKTITQSPILKIEDSLYTNIKTRKELIRVLQEHYSN